MSFQPAVNTLVGRMGVVPDVGLGHRRHVAGLQHGAAHDDDFAQQRGQRGFQLQRQAEVAQRPHGHQRDFARVSACHVHDELGGRTRIDLVVRGHARAQIAQTVGTMDEGGRRLRVLDPRGFDAPGDRDAWSARNGGEVQRVGGRLLDGDVAKRGGDAHHVNGRVRQREVKGHGVVNAGVGVVNDFAGSG